MGTLEALARAMTLLCEGRLLTAGVEDGEQSRDMAELAKVPREQLEARRAGAPAPGPPGDSPA